MPKEIVDLAFAGAERRLGSSPSGISALADPLQHVLRVVSAQGVLDNGGYRYFFESDWPDRPPYSHFVLSYQAIGCHAAANDLERVVATFPFPNPHLNAAARLEFIEANWDESTHEVRGWGDAICGDETVWSRLAEYCRKHSDAFDL
jgi:hypothetical protein